MDLAENPTALLIEVAVATALGLLIGLEREFAQRERRHRFAGLRTFALVALFGYVATLLAQASSIWVLAVALLSMIAFAIVGYFSESKSGDIGATSEMALVITFVLGALVRSGQNLVAVSVAVIVTLLLSMKLPSKSVVARMSAKDLEAIIKFAIVAFLIAPFLPKEAIDPWHVLVPSEIWKVVILVLSTNLLGYALAKFWQAEKGILVTGLLGGLVSSTAVTWTFSRKSREAPALAPEYLLGIVLAIAVMFVRVFCFAVIIAPSFGYRLLGPLLAMCVAGGGMALITRRSQPVRRTESQESIPLGNPFNFISALKMGALYSGILVLVAYLQGALGERGIYAAGVVSGLIDVDAFTISMARLSDANATEGAFVAVLLAILSNNCVKYLIAASAMPRSVQKQLGIVFASYIVFGLVFLI